MPTISIETDLQELFTDLHQSGLFADGKTISDAVLTKNPAQILAQYRQQRGYKNFDLLDFYQAHFTAAAQPESNYRSDTTRPVQEHIERLWPVLTRQPATAEGYSTLIPLPYPYVVPGGRFNEIYYWDSYFTMLGLQASGRVDMIESMVDNFTYLIDTYGFIPNGNRTYFLGRSQPPFYALMVSLLAEEQGEGVFKKYLPALEREHHFWMAGGRVVAHGGHLLNRYFDNVPHPRTEMYSDDIELLEHHGEGGEKLLLDIRAACESGWDFSSRWCAVPDDLATIHTTDILPVDLHCLLFFLEKTIAHGQALTGQHARAQHFEALAENRKARVADLFWNEATGFFHDFDVVKNKRTEALTLAGIFPLFLHLADASQAEKCAAVIEENFLRDGGLVTTPVESGQQWDAPNGWAPLQWVTIQGLRNYGHVDLAEKIKSRWTNLNGKVFQATGKLMEKYNVENIGLESGGGEYPVQDGFGWTNGVLLKLLSEGGSAMC